MLYKKTLGRFGEDEAETFLKKNGYKIIERNYKTKGCEIDIIAKSDSYYIFIEVKTRTSDEFGFAAEAVGFLKQEKIKRGAAAYLNDNLNDSDISFDIIEVYVTLIRSKMIVERINHIKSAF